MTPEGCNWLCCRHKLPTFIYIQVASILYFSAVTTTPESIFTSDSPDVEPTHIPGGICDKFSSALCEHYCHDAPDRPNKFRCTCRRGYELSANQSNCVESCKFCLFKFLSIYLKENNFKFSGNVINFK